MIILGLSHLAPSPVGHDSIAAIINDGQIIAAVSEERFSKVKHYAGYPANAIKYCLAEAGIRLNEIDRVAVGFGILKENSDNSKSGEFSQHANLYSN